MAKLTTAKRNSLPKSTFALPGQRKYPIPDRTHAINALARATQSGNPSIKAKVDAKVRSKFPNLTHVGNRIYG